MKNYAKQWRVKLTISNFNYKRNYSDWNVLVQHPGFSQKAEAYSFNKTVLQTVGYAGEQEAYSPTKNIKEKVCCI